MEYLLLIAGFILLIKGADIFVDGSSSVARLLKVPSVIIGLTIVSVGTSAPEAAVSIVAGISGNNEIAISNVLGSNLFNILIVIGVCALIRAFNKNKDIIKRDLPVNIIATAVLLIMLSDGILGRIDGVILLLLMAGYIFVLIRHALKNRGNEEAGKIMSPIKSIIFIGIGIGAIILGGELVVKSASAIAVSFGMSETLVGLTIVAVGTSLPELVTSVVAASKGESGLALGNAVGSSIFNILLILGISSTLSPITVLHENFIDTVIVLGISVLLYIFGVTSKKMSRWEGAVYVLLYLGYIIYAIIR